VCTEGTAEGRQQGAVAATCHDAMGIVNGARKGGAGGGGGLQGSSSAPACCAWCRLAWSVRHRDTILNCELPLPRVLDAPRTHPNFAASRAEWLCPCHPTHHASQGELQGRLLKDMQQPVFSTVQAIDALPPPAHAYAPDLTWSNLARAVRSGLMGGLL